MENLSQIVKHPLLLFIFCIAFQFGYSQTDYFVHSFQGEPYIEVNDSIKPVKRGTILDSETILTMNRSDVVNFIDSKGYIFELYDTGSFTNNELSMIPARKDVTSFTRKVFSYVWKEFTNDVALRNNKSGVVYRGDIIILKKFPEDDVSIASGEIRFEWDPIENKEKDYYFQIREKGSGNLTTIGTPGLSLSFLLDDVFLVAGREYEWTVTESKFPDLKKTQFFSFKILTDDEFDAMKDDIEELQNFYKKLGLNKAEIRQTLCLDYKICY